ncbi:hypothetical protein FRC02_003840 [Tulasnella sp. 418]|nr:hypothetical protein FRC02_003840 [Tulasnella sp. 418]
MHPVPAFLSEIGAFYLVYIIFMLLISVLTFALGLICDFLGVFTNWFTIPFAFVLFVFYNRSLIDEAIAPYRKFEWSREERAQWYHTAWDYPSHHLNGGRIIVCPLYMTMDRLPSACWVRIHPSQGVTLFEPPLSCVRRWYMAQGRHAEARRVQPRIDDGSVKTLAEGPVTSFAPIKSFKIKHTSFKLLSDFGEHAYRAPPEVQQMNSYHYTLTPLQNTLGNTTTLVEWHKC